MYRIHFLTALAFCGMLFSAQDLNAQIASPSMIQDEVMKVSGITGDNQIYPLTTAQKQTKRVYLDGFGRPIQQVNVGASPSGKDILDYKTYNIVGANGATITQFLPYVGADGVGEYHPSAASEQTAFYRNGLSDKVIDDSVPSSQIILEASPYQRPQYSGTDGAGFQPVPGSGSQHFKTIITRTNNSSVYINDSYNTGIRMWNYDGTSAGVYPTGSLIVTEVTDESANVFDIYKDAAGRQVLKRQIITSQVVDGTTEYCLDTYFIYDNASELVAVVTPKALTAIRNANGNPWNISTASTLIFQYVYDNLGRITQKLFPSSGWVYYVYDPMNRLVLSQDANLRSANKWNYFKYDSKGRVVSKGIYIDAVNTTQAGMTAFVSGQSYGVFYYEDRQVGTTFTNCYTNRVFPVVNYDQSALLDLEYIFYDDYDLAENGTPTQYQVQGLAGEETPSLLTRGMETIVNKRAFNNDLALNTWTQYVYYHDKRGNLIQIKGHNHTYSSGYGDIKTIVPDFTGKSLIVKTQKTISTTSFYTTLTTGYDNNNRLTTVDESINGATAVRVAQYIYNELGQLVNKKLHSTDDVNFLQDVDFRYNIRNALTSINNSTLSVDNTNYTNADANDLFGEEILYEKSDALIVNSPKYNGNISAVKWEAQSTTNSQRSYVYAYDQLNRLTAAKYQDRLYQSTGAWGNADANDENVTKYDLSGNIESLQRYSGGTEIDNLSYSYTGNQLTNVADAGTTAGFNGANTSAYTFATNGNLTADPKKGVTISYNVLNKTDKIIFTATGNYIRYSYDADGIMVRKETYVSSTASTTTYDYIDGVVAQNLVLSYFATSEGRVRYSGTAYTFEYFIRDHLGNVRVSFDGTGTSAVVRQENSFYPFGMTLPGNNVPTLPNKNLFNGGSEWQNDFSNLPDLYQTYNRNYDPEVGRFISVDPMADARESISTYHFAGNNPIGFSDPTGAIDIPSGAPGSLQRLLQANDELANDDDAGWIENAWGQAPGSDGVVSGGSTGGGGGAGGNGQYYDAWQAYLTGLQSTVPEYFNVYNSLSSSTYMLDGQYEFETPNWDGSYTFQDGNEYEYTGTVIRYTSPTSDDESEEVDPLEKPSVVVTLAADTYGTALAGANVLAKQAGTAFKVLTRSGTVVGAIAGGAPAVYNIITNFMNHKSQSLKDWAGFGLAVVGVVSEFTGLGELYDGTVGLGVAAVSLGYDVYSAIEIVNKK
jgi:RHS repeat-associated protein